MKKSFSLTVFYISLKQEECSYITRIQYIWKYLHVKTKVAFNSLSVSFDNFPDSLACGNISSVHYSGRYWFQCRLDSFGNGSKIFWSYLLIQSILVQPLFDNMKDVSDRVQIRSSSGTVNFEAPTSSQPDLAFTLLCEVSPSCRKCFSLGLAFF